MNKLIKGPRKKNFRILGARIWISFVRSGGAKTGGIASSFEDFGAPGAGEDGLKPGCIDAEIIFARALNRLPLRRIMSHRIQLFNVLIAFYLVLILWGCHNDAPRAAAAISDNNCQKLLEQLTAVNEAERFEVIGEVKSQIGQTDPKEIEGALASLRPKNLSTLIYVCIETRNPVLYHLSPPARQALENSTGSYPNIAYYYARVNPDDGLKALFGLYERYPDKRLPVCLAIGEVRKKEASDFLLAEAKAVKAEGGTVTYMLAGLKHSSRSVDERDLDWFLIQSLDREELIALSELDFELPVDKVKTYWKSGGARRFFAIELVMGQPDRLFDALCWMIDQYMNAGDTDTVKQLIMSDSMRSVTCPRVQEFRQFTLKKLQRMVTGNR